MAALHSLCTSTSNTARRLSTLTPFSAKAGGACHHHASLSEIQLFHALTTIHVGDGAVHALHLHFLSQQIAEIVEFPVYSGYAAPCKGQLYLRAPPVI
ncbi:MAG: hypothetical protein LUD46_03655 [Parabacteroides sp.]|nr:hypothetical protein [Parabacteroides sp.]